MFLPHDNSHSASLACCVPYIPSSDILASLHQDMIQTYPSQETSAMALHAAKRRQVFPVICSSTVQIHYWLESIRLSLPLPLNRKLGHANLIFFPCQYFLEAWDIRKSAISHHFYRAFSPASVCKSNCHGSGAACSGGPHRFVLRVQSI